MRLLIWNLGHWRFGHYLVIDVWNLVIKILSNGFEIVSIHFITISTKSVKS